MDCIRQKELNMSTLNKSKTENNIYKYKKRSGTTGIAGSLYRSHLLSLILSRNLNHEMEFVLGCNVEDIGVMNEICLIHKDNKEKPVAVFIKTKNVGNITDNDLYNPKSALNLFQCYQSYLSIKEKYDKDPDALFVGRFENTEPYFVIYTPHQSKIKSNVAVSADDKIYTEKVHRIICTGDNSKIYKVQNEGLVTHLINAKIERIGKIIAAYVTSHLEDRGEINKEMKNILMEYHNFVIPHVVKINERDKNCYGLFNEALYENNNTNIKSLRKVLFDEVLKKSKVKDETASGNIHLLLETNEYTADLLSTLIGTVITFDENTKKFAYMPGVSDLIKQQSLDKIEVNEIIVDEAFAIAGMKALECIKIDFNELGMKEIITKEAYENEHINLECIFEDEKQKAKLFLNHFYIYAEQGKEHNLSKRLREEIVKSRATNKNATIFLNKPEVVVVEFHSKVQKWMLLIDKPEYLTNSCNFLEDHPNIVNPLLSILNYNCVMELQGHSLIFNSKSFNLFSKLDDTKSHTNIITNNVLLTSMKLMQFFSDKSCLFVNFEHVYNMKDMEFNMLLQEVNRATIKTLVVIFKKHAAESYKFKEVVNSFPDNIFAISKYHVEDFETIYDTIKGLEDIDNSNEVLKHNITVQGEKVEIGKIVDEKAINLINAGILFELIKNESIEIGQSLLNSSYQEIKDCFVNRQLCEYASSCDQFTNHIHSKNKGDLYTNFYAHYDLRLDISFDFLSKDAVVCIFAEPGMGKSTLLTHLSIKMKRDYPNKWIVKMNLSKYSEDFFKWENGTDVDLIKSLNLVCRAELNNKAFDELFTLKKGSDGDLVLLESKELDPIAALHLKLVIHCFNSGNLTFFFDGFDEICPHYEKVVVQFMKNLVNIDTVDDKSECFVFGTPRKPHINDYMLTDKYVKEETTSKKNQIWITSRPYNVLATTLKKEFNIKPLHLTRLTREEQFQFYEQYWKTLLKLEELNSDQFQNVEAFFKYMNMYRICDDLPLADISNNILQRRMQEAAVDYLRSKVDSLAGSNIDKTTLLSKWISISEMITTEYGFNFQAGDGYLDELQLAGIPLHMKVHADLFVHEIKDTSSTKIWDMGVHTFQFYNRFLEIKLKKIRFEEKCGENVNTSAFLTDYENWLEEATEEHKQLAFYAFFHNASSHFKNVLSENKWVKIRSMMERIKKAEEKTGLIDRIHEGVPRFVHPVFAKYYAVEYIADMLKKNTLTDEQVHRQINFVVNCLFKSSVGIMKAFNYKLKNDGDLRKVLDQHDTRKFIFTVWMEQDITRDKKQERIIKDNTGLPELNEDTYLQTILRHELIEIIWILLKSIKDNLNSANIEKFVDIIGSDFFEFAIIFHSDDLIIYVLDAIRRVDPTMVVKALLSCDLQLGDHPENDLIISRMRCKTKNLRTVVIPSTDTASGDRLYSIGAVERWTKDSI